MKSVFTLLIVLCMGMATQLSAQVTMQLYNYSNCNLFFSMRQTPLTGSSACTSFITNTYAIAANTTTPVTVTAQPGYEWVVCTISQNAICPPGSGVLFEIGNDNSGTCATCSTFVPSSNGAQTNGCGACQRGVDGDWNTCAGTLKMY